MVGRKWKVGVKIQDVQEGRGAMFGGGCLARFVEAIVVPACGVSCDFGEILMYFIHLQDLIKTHHIASLIIQILHKFSIDHGIIADNA